MPHLIARPLAPTGHRKTLSCSAIVLFLVGMPKFKWMLRDDHPRNFIPATGPSAEHADTPCGQHGISRRERWLQCQNLIVLCRRLQRTYVAYIAHVRLTTPEHRRTLAHFDISAIEPSDCRPKNSTMAGSQVRIASSRRSRRPYVCFI